MLQSKYFFLIWINQLMYHRTRSRERQVFIGRKKNKKKTELWGRGQKSSHAPLNNVSNFCRKNSNLGIFLQ